MINGFPVLKKACRTVWHKPLSLGGPNSLAQIGFT